MVYGLVFYDLYFLIATLNPLGSSANLTLR